MAIEATEVPQAEPAPAKKDVAGKFSWTVYFKGKEGYAESINLETGKVQELQSARATITLWLQAIEAETLPRDKEGVKTGGWGRPSAPAAPKGNGAPAPQTGAAPVCPEDGAPMTMRPGGISKTSGKPYGPFWSCTNFPNCKGRANA